MSFQSVLYISKSLVAPQQTEIVARTIVDTSIVRNTAVGITGALLCTGPYFAQVIEGDAAPIDALLVRLRSDPRHSDLKVVDQATIEQRRFGDWSMAYLGQSQFVSQHVTRLLSDPPTGERQRAAEWLAALLGEFAGSR